MLLLHHSTDPTARYSRYLGEILILEGFNGFAEAELAHVDAATLARHDLVVLPRCAPSPAQLELLMGYVRGGGRLLACLPDPRLMEACGVKPTWSAIDRGYLHLDPTQAAVAGLVSEPFQVVVPAVGMATGGAAATLGTVRPGPQADGEGIPGVVTARAGAGKVALVAYDLPYAVARLRQGDPEHADLCYSGLDGIIRPSELFVGQLAVEQMALPQADLHGALLARLVEELAGRPRLWYYPTPGEQSALIMTSDDDWSTLEQFQAILDGLAARQAHCTFYVVPGTNLTPALIDRWRGQGHTFSVHPALAKDYVRGVVHAPDVQRNTVAPMLRENVTRHVTKFGGQVRTIRQHAIRWHGYVETARELAGLGVAMEANFVSVHPFPVGFMAGSGRPLPFVDTDGSLIPVYQQPTMWTEEVLIHPSFVFSFKWTVEHALHEVGASLRRAVGDFYTPVTINSHPVSFATYSSPLVEGTWDQALDLGMRVVSPDEWLDWTLARRSVTLDVDATGVTARASGPVDAVTILAPGDTGDGERVRLWGRDYRAVTLRGLAAGEARRVALRAR